MAIIIPDTSSLLYKELKNVACIVVPNEMNVLSVPVLGGELATAGRTTRMTLRDGLPIVNKLQQSHAGYKHRGIYKKDRAKNLVADGDFLRVI